MNTPFVTPPETDIANGLLRASLSAAELAGLFALGAAQHYPARRTIFAEGGSGDTLLLIERGRVEISHTAASGRRSILAQIGAGEVVGEIAAFDGKPRSADAVAATEVTGRMLLRAQMLSFLSERPDLAQTVIATLCGRLRGTNAALTDHVLTDGQTRLARCLARLFDRWAADLPNGQRRLDTRFSQSDLGDMTGLSRESVNRYLGGFEAGGVLGRETGALVLHDARALLQLAGEPA